MGIYIYGLGSVVLSILCPILWTPMITSRRMRASEPRKVSYRRLALRLFLASRSQSGGRCQESGVRSQESGRGSHSASCPKHQDGLRLGLRAQARIYPIHRILCYPAIQYLHICPCARDRASSLEPEPININQNSVFYYEFMIPTCACPSATPLEYNIRGYASQYSGGAACHIRHRRCTRAP